MNTENMNTENMSKEQLEQKIKELVGDLYLKTYIYDFYYTGPIEDKNVQNYIINDWRFNEYYRDYISRTDASRTDEPLKKKEWARHLFNKDPELLYRIIKEFLNMTDDMKPEQLYIDEEYPFRFEFLTGFNRMTYDEFFTEIHSEFMKTVSKLFFDLTPEEIRRRFIVWLENENDRLQKKIDESRKERLPQRKIYKYDKNGLLDKIYNDRQECCKAEGITKAALSMHLAGKRKTIKGFTYKEV